MPGYILSIAGNSPFVSFVNFEHVTALRLFLMIATVSLAILLYE